MPPPTYLNVPLDQLAERYGNLDELTVDVDGDTVHDVSAEEYVENWPE